MSALSQEHGALAALATAWLILALFALLGAGLSVWLLGARYRRLWPLTAPVVGFASIAVLGDVPSFLFGADVYAWPLFLALAALNIALLFKHRRALQRSDAHWLCLPLAFLPFALLPYLRLGALTTLSEHNHDWVYYLNLETSLAHDGYASSWADTGGLFHDMSCVLRRGGWRAGISIVGSFVGALLNLRPHQVDGAMWCVLHAIFPSTALAGFSMLVPRSSKQARAFVLIATAFSGPALLLLRMSFASHLASMPLFTLLVCVTWRALRERAAQRRALAALLLAASITVLADGAPYLVSVLLGLTIAAQRQRTTPWRRLIPRLGWGIAALAIIPASLYRIYLSLYSLSVTGYHPPAARFDASLHALLPTLLGQHAHEVNLAEWHHLPFLAVLVAVAGALGLSSSFRRVRSRGARAGLLTPLFIAILLILYCDMMELDYPAWKIALTASPFSLFALATALDRAPHARIMGGALLASQLLTVAYAMSHAPPPLGVLPMHERLVNTLRAHPGEVHLLGHHGSPVGVLHEHALAYLFEQDGRRLRAIAHPSSYLRISWPRDDFAVRSDAREVLVITSDEDRVIAEDAHVIHRSGLDETMPELGEFTVMALGAGSAAASIQFAEGFLPREVEPTFAFRWSDARSVLYVDLPTEDSCFTATLRGSPDGDAQGVLVTAHAMAPHAYFGAPELVVARRAVPLEAHWMRRTLAHARTPQTVMLELTYLGQRHEPRVDTRPIHFALGALELRRGAACVEAP